MLSFLQVCQKHIQICAGVIIAVVMIDQSHFGCNKNFEDITVPWAFIDILTQQKTHMQALDVWEKINMVSRRQQESLGSENSPLKFPCILEPGWLSRLNVGLGFGSGSGQSRVLRSGPKSGVAGNLPGFFSLWILLSAPPP